MRVSPGTTGPPEALGALRRKRLSRPARIALLIVAGLAILCGILDHALDWGAKVFLRSLLSDTFHGRVRIGEIRIDLLSGRVRAARISVENRPWGIEKHLMAASEIRVQVELIPLFHERIHVTSLEVVSPVFSFEEAGERDNLNEALDGTSQAGDPPAPHPRRASLPRDGPDGSSEARRPGVEPRRSGESGKTRSASRQSRPNALQISIPVPFRVDRAEIRDGRAVYVDHGTGSGAGAKQRVRKLELTAIHAIVTNLSSETPYDRVEAKLALKGSFLAAGQNLDVRVDANPFSRLFPFEGELTLTPTPVVPLSPWAEPASGFRLLDGTVQVSAKADCRRALVAADIHFEGRGLRLEQLGGVEIGNVLLIQLPPEVVMMFIEREHGQLTFDSRVKGDLRDPRMDWSSAVSGAIVTSVTKEILSKVGSFPTDTGSTILDKLGSFGNFVEGLFR